MKLVQKPHEIAYLHVTRMDGRLKQVSLYMYLLVTGWTNKDAAHSLIEPRHEKETFCICENKDADQLRGNHEADQHLCFRYTDSTIPLLPKS